METTITIEPASVTHISDNPQKRPSINYLSTIPLDIYRGKMRGKSSSR